MMTRADVILEALGDPTRSRIVELLLSEPLTQKQIRDRAGIEASAVSRQMNKLRDAGLVIHAGGHGPYMLRAETETRNALLSIGELALRLSRLAVEEDEAHVRALKRTALRVAPTGTEE